MENCKTKFLVSFFIFIVNIGICFAHEKIDTMCGIWSYIYGDGSYDSLAIEKISFTEYLIMYTSSYDHVHDMVGKGSMVSKNLIYIKRNDDEEFFVYLDYDKDSVYFLWNHAFPDPVFYDTELKRASEIFDENLQSKKEAEFKRDIENSIRKYFKSLN